MSNNDTKCNQNFDPLKLVREGTNQDQRKSLALDPAYAPVDERGLANGIVFAKAYAAYVRYCDTNNLFTGNWTPFFNADVSLQLAEAATQDVDGYCIAIKEYLDYLDNRDNENHLDALRNNLGLIFSALATLAQGLDRLKEALPPELPLQQTLKHLIQSQLAEAFQQLILFYRDGITPKPAHSDTPFLNVVESNLLIFGAQTTFSTLKDQGLSNDWILDNSAANWKAYLENLEDNTGSTNIYGSGASLFDRVNFIARNNLFTAVLDKFLKAFARIVNDAQSALQNTLTNWNHHEPHYALFLTFLRLFEYGRNELNTLTGRHLDFYYREVLRLKEKPAQAHQAFLLAELAKHVATHEIAEGELFKAGKDQLGKEAFFANDLPFVANQAKVAALMSVYRHSVNTSGSKQIERSRTIGATRSTKGAVALSEKADSFALQIEAAGKKKQTVVVDRQLSHRIYASPIANSDDGLGEPLSSTDQSWHPFFNKKFEGGSLQKIQMPFAELGFAIASHYLLLAEGNRSIKLDFTSSSLGNVFSGLGASDFVACLSTAEGWIEATVTPIGTTLAITLSGNDPAIVGYAPKIHGYTFETELPILLIKLKQDPTRPYIFDALQSVVVDQISLSVTVTGLKTLALSNDFGPIDAAKPFQPFGARPQIGSSLIIGSVEVFQKKLTTLTIKVGWQEEPKPYGPTFTVALSYLDEGNWKADSTKPIEKGAKEYPFSNANQASIETPNLSPNEPYTTESRSGFIRLKLVNDFGYDAYENALITYIKLVPGGDSGTKPVPPVGPFIVEFSLNYTATQTINLKSGATFPNRQAKCFHLYPFGQAEQHSQLSAENRTYLLPQFAFEREGERKQSEAEFYIGLDAVQAPQNVALLFQVVDGSADPLAKKPTPHLHWSYLEDNNWVGFHPNEINDQTAELLKSGVITFALPRSAKANNTLLPSGKHWIRAAVSEASNAICQLILVAAQGFSTTFADQGNDPAFSAQPLVAGSISKLKIPTAAVKKITQPFAAINGRGAESSSSFYARISERLRHKDRAIALWDYEHLVLEAFPQIYQVKCLNHTHYEPTEAGGGIYRELAPGHVTIVTIPNQQAQKLINPLHPYTSLGLLDEIQAYLQKRVPCFVQLHVKNPQFESLRVNFKVRFFDGFDESYYRIQLQKAITRYLSPWAFSNDSRPNFGGKVYKASLINFVEEQPYVDYVTDFQLFQDIGGIKGTANLVEAKGSLAISILVSVPADQHAIEVITPAEEQQLREQCNCEV